MFAADAPKISSPLVQAIEDAILLGNVKEIDGVLELISEDEDFPEDIRYALESLRYFRAYYGKGGVCEAFAAADKAKAQQMESLWVRELIAMLGHHPDMSEVKYA